MSNSNSGSIQRPKRSNLKQHDDNVLGISWKEERELRKAMYVSLRQQQQKADISQPKRLRSRHSALQSNMLSHWCHKRVTSDRLAAEHKLRTAKLRASVRSSQPDATLGKATTNGIATTGSKPASGRNQKTPNRPESKELSSQLRNSGSSVKLNSNSSKINRGSVVRTKRTSNLVKRRNPISPRKRSTLTSAARDRKKESKPSDPKVSRPSAHCVRLQSPNNFTPLSPQSKINTTVTGLASPPAIDSPFKLPANPASKNRTLASNETISRTPQRCLFSDDLVIRGSIIRSSGGVVPPELCQDPAGHPVSVHDFVEFVCYRGTPYLDSRLKWFDTPHAMRSSFNSTSLAKPVPSTNSDTSTPVNGSTQLVNSDSPSRSTFCIAKKLASVVN